MTTGRLLPARLRHHSRVTAIQCRACGLWRRPRHIRIPAMVCRDCETSHVFQAWESPNPVAAATMAGHPAGGTR